MASVKLERIFKRFGDTEVVSGVDLDIPDGDFVVLVGPSGCGKSTVLRMIAGLETVSDGNLYIGNRLVNHLSPRDRDVAMVFQSYALYPRMTVRENIGFGLRLQKRPSEEIAARVEKVADIVGLRNLLDRKPRQLSGGQRQRVAMGRAIVREPAVFLFDEPLSNIDAKLRVQMRAEIAKLHQQLGTTTIYVTHDQVEAMTLAKLIVVLDRGVVQQSGDPLDVYRHPVNLFVAGFIGTPAMNFFDVRVTATNGGLTLHGQGVELPVPEHLRDRAGEPDRPLVLGIRPEHLSESDQPGTIAAKVIVMEQLGADVHAICEVDGQPLTARLDPDTPARVGSTIRLAIEHQSVHLFDKQTGSSLSPQA
jgi:ABC-type sugar transport system ATPase subunit